MSETCEGCHGSGGNWDCGGQSGDDVFGCECWNCTGCEACPECNGCGVYGHYCDGNCHAELGCCDDLEEVAE